MPKRTYIPMLLHLLYLTCQYIKRWQDQLRANLTPEQETLLNAVLVACEAFRAAVPHE